jgi:hypothetical protein
MIRYYRGEVKREEEEKQEAEISTDPNMRRVHMIKMIVTTM